MSAFETTRETTMFRAGHKLGKYKIERRLAEGSFANVYRALDTIEGNRVALKIPHDRLITSDVLKDFRDEVRLMARLSHPNILPLKDANFVGAHFVIAFPLGERTLADRMLSRMSLRTLLSYTDQMLAAVAYAHSHRVIHCDIKPENLILFADGRLLLTDFGISKVARRTVQGSGWGTLGYVAPEQALGKPSFRSDVFSLGLIFYRMLSGKLPEWPYEWPPPAFDRVRRRAHPDLAAVVRKAMEVSSRKRYGHAGQMRAAFQRAKTQTLRHANSRRSQKTGRTANQSWQLLRFRHFRRECGRALESRFECPKCAGPISEAMNACPWCGVKRSVHREDTPFPAQCPRCGRGMKLDWRYCPWCYGPGFEPATNRQYSDVRYQTRCSNLRCSRRDLMPFMLYCPWCRRKVRRKWKVPGSTDTCKSCGWGVVRSYWSWCPWCGSRIGNL